MYSISSYCFRELNNKIMEMRIKLMFKDNLYMMASLVFRLKFFCATIECIKSIQRSESFTYRGAKRIV